MSRYLKPLLDLVDMAGERPLTADEAGRLREGLEALDGYRRRAGAVRAKSSRGRLEGRKGNAA